MGISAIYGTGIYNQSRYGWVYLKAQTSITFSEQAFTEGLFPTSGSTNLTFSSTSKITQGIVGNTSVVFDQASTIRSSIPASVSITFSEQGFISAARSRIAGITNITFDEDGFLEGKFPSRGNSTISFDTKGNLFGQGEMLGDTLIKFDIRDSWINVNRIKATNGIRFDQKAEIIYTNKNPYYPTWNGKYEDLSKETDPSIGYFGLLYVETSGNTTPPYIETTE